MLFLALLRGINVGGNKRVEMPKLKQIFEELGYANVSTYINTGNVLFESSSEEFSAIEPALEKAFGFEIRVVVRSAENIKSLCEKIPEEWQNDGKQKTDVLFLWDEFDRASVLEEIRITPELDRVEYFQGALIWNIEVKDWGKSGMSKFVGTPLYKNMTARNVNTVRKLNELLELKK